MSCSKILTNDDPVDTTVYVVKFSVHGWNFGEDILENILAHKVTRVDIKYANPGFYEYFGEPVFVPLATNDNINATIVAYEDNGEYRYNENDLYKILDHGLTKINIIYTRRESSKNAEIQKTSNNYAITSVPHKHDVVNNALEKKSTTSDNNKCADEKTIQKIQESSKATDTTKSALEFSNNVLDKCKTIKFMSKIKDNSTSNAGHVSRSGRKFKPNMYKGNPNVAKTSKFSGKPEQKLKAKRSSKNAEIQKTSNNYAITSVPHKHDVVTNALEKKSTTSDNNKCADEKTIQKIQEPSKATDTTKSALEFSNNVLDKCKTVKFMSKIKDNSTSNAGHVSRSGSKFKPKMYKGNPNVAKTSKFSGKPEQKLKTKRSSKNAEIQKTSNNYAITSVPHKHDVVTNALEKISTTSDNNKYVNEKTIKIMKKPSEATNTTESALELSNILLNRCKTETSILKIKENSTPNREVSFNSSNVDHVSRSGRKIKRKIYTDYLNVAKTSKCSGLNKENDKSSVKPEKIEDNCTSNSEVSFNSSNVGHVSQSGRKIKPKKRIDYVNAAKSSKCSGKPEQNLKTKEHTTPTLNRRPGPVGKYKVPFKYGWTRVVTIRKQKSEVPRNKPTIDIYYYLKGKQFRSSIEVGKFLAQSSSTALTLDNFSFKREPLFCGIRGICGKEIIRHAK